MRETLGRLGFYVALSVVVLIQACGGGGGASPGSPAGSTGTNGSAGNPTNTDTTVTPPQGNATAPTLSNSNVSEGATEVPLSASIVLTFSEPIAPASVSAITLRARYSGGPLSQLSYITTGNTVAINPVPAWERGKTYTIEIDGVTNMAGTPVTAAQLHFVTDPGRFAEIETLTPESGNGIYNGTAGAIGDLNGDGRDDVVLKRFTSNGVSGVNETLLYLQQSDGRLSSSTVVPLQSGCPAYAVKIADFNGDGRKDLVAAGNCGIELFLQSAGGTLVSNGLFGSAVGKLQVADIDGDGRADLVAIPSPDTTDDSVQIWLNKATGWELLGTWQVAALSHVRELAVGDLNGDGRPDIAFIADMPTPAANGPAGVFYQSSNGNFTLAWLPIDGGSTATSVAVGDLNGDGRADLALTRYLGIEIFPQLPNGSLGAARSLEGDGIQPQALKLVDINDDGRLDTVVVYNARDLVVRLQQTDGTLGSATRYTDVSRGANADTDMVAHGDVNGDGRLDVLVYGHVFLQRAVPTMAP